VGLRVNRDAYNRIARQWDQARTSFYGRERDYLDAPLADLPASSPILDLGCGSGRPLAEYVLARGHCITGVDQAGELLAIARTRFPDATWIESRLEDFAFERRYAGIICWDARFHIERTWHDILLSRMARSLRPGTGADRGFAVSHRSRPGPAFNPSRPRGRTEGSTDPHVTTTGRLDIHCAAAAKAARLPDRTGDPGSTVSTGIPCRHGRMLPKAFREHNW
jgi:SAM-dependent methyltransferase